MAKLTLCDEAFQGPYTKIDELGTKSGVYAITTKTAAKKYRILDVGESGDIKGRINDHDRKDCWTRSKADGIQVWVRYTTCGTADQRRKLASCVRDAHNPACGKI